MRSGSPYREKVSYTKLWTDPNFLLSIVLHLYGQIYTRKTHHT